jgi:3-oxoacyl-[acyl-carrier protein] reductase
MRLKDKVAIITGAGSGIGKETAFLFSKEGAKVVVADVNETAGKSVAAKISKGGKACFFKVNVSSSEEVKRLVAMAIEKYGRIDVLINNAGITRDALLAKMTEEQWHQVIEVNVKGVFNCTQAVAEVMVKQGSGVILNASSTVGIYGNIGQANYAASKAAVIGLTKTLAKELGRKGVRVNAVAPGFILSPMTKNVPERTLQLMKDKTPLGKLGTSKDVAYAYLYLASDEASYVNGAVFCVDGGLTI